MTTGNAAIQHEDDSYPEEVKRKTKSVFSNENTERTFDELSEVFQDNQKQMVKARKIIKVLSGDFNTPGTLWRLIESYGEPTNKEDSQEHVLQYKKNVWSVRRVNKTHEWDVSSALELFKLGYLTSSAEPGSTQQESAFDAFQCFLEKVLDQELSLCPETWWSIIDDASDLYKTATVRSVRLDVLDSLGEELSPFIVKAVRKPVPAEYALHFTDGNSNAMPEMTPALCVHCHSTVDGEDFYCRHCGGALGSE